MHSAHTLIHMSRCVAITRFHAAPTQVGLVPSMREVEREIFYIFERNALIANIVTLTARSGMG